MRAVSMAVPIVTESPGIIRVNEVQMLHYIKVSLSNYAA